MTLEQHTWLTCYVSHNLQGDKTFFEYKNPKNNKGITILEIFIRVILCSSNKDCKIANKLMNHNFYLTLLLKENCEI